MELDIRRTVSGDKGVVAVSGEVDVSNADALKEAVAAYLKDDAVHAIEVDLSQVPYIDSTGIGVLVGGLHRAEEAGKRLVATGVQPNVARIFGMLGVDGIIA